MEALERSGKILATAVITFIIFWSQCNGVDGHRNTTKMSYVCPPHFIRLGHSCYYFSENTATWQNALFACKDRDSNLTVPARWEDRNLRNYLNNPDIERAERWIGGIYDYGARSWKWGGELKQMRYQSFSKMEKLKPEKLQWHCIAMIPDLWYRWAPRSCVKPRQYICQTKLRKIPKSKVKDYSIRWEKMGKINEITAPSVSAEIGDPRINDVTANPAKSPKSYDLRPPSPLRLRPGTKRLHQRYSKSGLRPNEVTKRSRPTATSRRRLTPPFPGYSWNRRDPEASYRYNVDLLRSGHTGLSPQQVSTHLRRLRRVRDKQLSRQKRLREGSDWLVNTPRKNSISEIHARTYTVDNNISALHPKTIVEEFEIPPNNLQRPVRWTG